MGRALYRKYRSKSLDEIVGQEHITTTIKNAIKSDKISHAYLFTGPRGIGKTSIARILAHEVNKLSYTDDTNHIDIIEIDAASNRRIDEIRDLREKVHITPTSAKYKVYIIDEVHMLTNEAFNALLKTLEEPPPHIIFILATTEPHKLPETIVSRTQRFNFKLIDIELITSHLTNISEKENIQITNDAIELIAQHGRGSLRDSISLLDQASSLKQVINVSDVEEMLGIPPLNITDTLFNSMMEGDSSAIVDQLTAIRKQGILSINIAEQINIMLRNHLLYNKDIGQIIDVHKTMRELVELPTSHDPDTLLEIILLSSISPINKQTKEQGVTNRDKIIIDTESKPSLPASTKTVITTEPAVGDNIIEGTSNDTLWQQILHDIKQKHSTLYGIVRMAHASFKDNNMILKFDFPFHYNRTIDKINQDIIEKIASKHLGYAVSVICKLTPKTNNKPKDLGGKKSSANKPLDNVSAIFKNAELLE